MALVSGRHASGDTVLDAERFVEQVGFAAA